MWIELGLGVNEVLFRKWSTYESNYNCKSCDTQCHLFEERVGMLVAEELGGMPLALIQGRVRFV